MAVTFIDFVAAFSYALDTLTPEKGNRGARRAWITLHLAQTRELDFQCQQRLFLAALLLDLREHSNPARYAPLFDNGLPEFKGVAGLIEGSGPREECALLRLVQDLDSHTWHQSPKGEYPRAAVTALCKGIGKRYMLDDMLGLHELQFNPSFWKELACASLANNIAMQAPMVRRPVDDDTLLELSHLLSSVVDDRCRSVCRHSSQVAELSAGLAKLYGFSEGGILRLRIAGLLHDVGKLALPTSLLHKKEALNEYETRQFKMHAEYGGEILSRVPGMGEIARLVASHHERPDGNGYPLRQRGSQLDLAQRILAAANDYFSLREPRFGKPAFTPMESMTLLQEHARTGALDVDVVKTLVSWLNT
ncbi:HD-GYP domain-containing protein [Enterobacteriaceae bacterium C34A]